MSLRILPSALFSVAAIGVLEPTASAQEPAPRPLASSTDAKPAAPEPAPLVIEHATLGKVTLGGYVEVDYTHSFATPSNGVVNFRGFDERSDTFDVSNVALDTQWEKAAASARITLQVGQTPSAYYLSEPVARGTTSTPTTDGSTWKYLQQVYAGYKFPLGRGLTAQAGIFLSPIGIESMAVKDDWNWSRSNLFFALPFFHTGLRATQEITSKLSAMVAVFNGYNSVIDNNVEKSVCAQVSYTDSERLLFSAVYFGGVERPPNAPEGRPWRNLFDTWVQAKVLNPLWVAANADAGFEPGRFGTSWWGGAALYARVQPVSWLYLVGRADALREHDASNALGTATAMFLPVAWVASGTATVDVRPLDGLSVRAEYRHDQAAADLFFQGHVSGAGTKQNPFAPNAEAEDTVTFGAVAWF